MEDLHNGLQTITSNSESSEDNEKPPWRNVYHLEDTEMSTVFQLDGVTPSEISVEDIEESIKKFEELSRQIEERTSSNYRRDSQEGPLDIEHQRGERRRSSDEDRSTDGEGGARISLEELRIDHTEDEDERSKSDGETEELIRKSEPPATDEERSKSDGEKDEPREEDDDDTVPLRIKAAAAQKLTKLSLSNCWLKTMPAEVWDLTHVTELDLSANYIKKLSKSISNLAQLKKLRLNHNQLSVLPKELWTLTRLTTLFINNNNLKSIPKDIKNLTRLKTLDLSSNQITEIPAKEGILQLTCLMELRLRNNFITTIPPALAELSHLQVLWLEGNPLLSLPKSLLKKPANIILAYIKDHPIPKRPLEVKPRVLRKSPPLGPGKKTDFNILAEKEIKKRKYEQMEDLKKHMEVEKKVKQLEQELMLANAKALKYEEEVRRVEEQQKQETSPSLLLNPVPNLVASHPQFPLLQVGQFPDRFPRQHGVSMQSPNSNNFKTYLPAPNLIPNLNPNAPPNSLTSLSGVDKPNFEWEIPIAALAFGPRIGRGGYGEVYHAMWGGTEVAVKMLFNDNFNQKLVIDLRKEVDLLCKLRHPNILLFMGACTEPDTPCIVTEFLRRGSLANLLLDESIEMDWGLRLQLAIDCARGMIYLHSRNPIIIHRDLKTDNLLVDDNWQVKVADFGLATVKSRTFAKTMCGTTGWVAPEVLAEEGYTEKADVYSFAIILWELFTRQVPYAGKNTMQVVRSVDRGERLPIPNNCPADYEALINECWATDPARRPSFPEVLDRLEKIRAHYLDQKEFQCGMQSSATTKLVENGRCKLMIIENKDNTNLVQAGNEYE